MVRHFRNANEKFSVEPPGLAACFSSTDGNEKVQEFVGRTAAWSPLERTLVMQTYLLGALRDTSVVGKYSSMHDNAIYSLGYSNPRTVKLAYKYVFLAVGNSDANIEILFYRFAFASQGFAKFSMERKRVSRLGLRHYEQMKSTTTLLSVPHGKQSRRRKTRQTKQTIRISNGVKKMSSSRGRSSWTS